MKEGLRSGTLLKREKANVSAGASCDDSSPLSTDEASHKLGKGQRGRKRKYAERENVSDDTNSVDSKKNIGLDLVSAKNLVISALETKVEVGNDTVLEDCSKIADIDVQMGANASDDNKEKIGVRLISNDKDPANDSVIFSRDVEEGSGTEHAECSKDAVVDVEVVVNTEVEAKPDAEGDKHKERENVESPKKVNGANGSVDMENKGSPSILNSSDHVNAFVYSSPEETVDKGCGSEYVEYGREADGGVEVGANGHGDANINDDHDEGTFKHGKPQLEIEREKVESPKMGADVTTESIEKDRELLFSSHCLDSVKQSVVSTPKGECGGSESNHVECNKDTGESKHKLGKDLRGRKRKKVEGYEPGDHDAKRKEVNDGEARVIGRVLRPRTTAMSGGEKVVDGGTNVCLVVEKRMEETDQSDKKRVDTEMDESFQREKIKRPRGRPPNVQGQNGESKVICKENGESSLPIKKKIKGPRGRPPKAQMQNGASEMFCKKKIKRPRGRPPKVQGQNGASELICKGKDESSESIGMRRKKIKRPLGRPPKVQAQNGASDLTSEENMKIIRGSEVQKNTGASVGSTDNIEQTNAGEDTVEDSNYAETGRHNRVASQSHQAGGSSGKKKKKMKERKLNREGETGRREEKQLVREQIIGILKKAGWTIEYRPRQSKENYYDAVYVDCEGRGYWSVTLAYRKLKERVEGGDADSKAISAFTSIPEEMLSKLYRVTQLKKKKKKDKIPKQHGQAGKDPLKKKPTTNGSGGSKHNEKPKSFSKMKGDNSARSSHKGITRLKNGEKRQTRKPCALLARTSEKGVDKDNDGFMPYDGKRSLLLWMIDMGTVVLDEKVHYMKDKEANVMLEGKITRDGIQCGCCDKIILISDFESHAGSKLGQPFCNIYLESGVSLMQCLVDSWSKQEGSDRSDFHFVNIDGEDPSDDTCNICGDGGDLICCDSCPSTFHQNCLNIKRLPSGDWQCVYCLCKICGTVSRTTSERNDSNTMNVSELIICRLCERKFHPLCIHGESVINVASGCPSFCGSKCQELYEKLQVLVGVKQELEEGFSWTLLQRSDVISQEDTSLSSAPLKVESNAKLAVAFYIMDECFLPIVDERSGINMIHNVVFSCGSNFNRLNYSGFFTAILERGDEIISAASIRIHGNQLAEMPFIGTRDIYRRQGMCRRLLNAIESALSILDVEKLIIPAISELHQTWTSVFGFEPIEKSRRQEMKSVGMIVFNGIDMLQKPLLKINVEKGKSSTVSQIESDDAKHFEGKTIQATEEGKEESVDREQSSGFKKVKHGICESMKLQSGVNNEENLLDDNGNDFDAAQNEFHSLNRPQLCSKSSERDVCGSLVDQIVTLCDTEPLCNSSPCPTVTPFCTPSSACGVPEVGSCTVLKNCSPC